MKCVTKVTSTIIIFPNYLNFQLEGSESINEPKLGSCPPNNVDSLVCVFTNDANIDYTILFDLYNKGISQLWGTFLVRIRFSEGWAETNFEYFKFEFFERVSII